MKKILFVTLIVFVLFFTSCTSSEFFTSCIGGSSSERICASTPYGRHDYKKVEHKDPTCTEEGYDTFECSVCGMIRTDKISSSPHKYYKVDHKDPTCTEEGYNTFKCSKCGATRLERITKHNFYWEPSSVWIDYYKEKCRDCGKYSGRIKDHGKIYEL